MATRQSVHGTCVPRYYHSYWAVPPGQVLRIVAQGADAPEPTTLECIEGVYTDGVDCPSFVSPDVLREDGVRRLSRCDAHVACTALPVLQAKWHTHALF